MKYLFEISWEVCNKVGGIHTVLQSKAFSAQSAFGDEYYLLGPLLKHNTGFLETEDPGWSPVRTALQNKDLRFRLGRWQVAGSPRVILVDFRERYDANKLLFEYWQQFGVDSYGGQWDYIEPVLFSTACGEAIMAIHNECIGEDTWSVAHFHEWMSGGGLLYLKGHVPEMGTVFTTHATVLGRSLASRRQNIYTKTEDFNPDQEARANGVSAKHSMESACAREADVFTTVSEVTAEEARVVLKRNPDVVVYNGFDLKESADRVPSLKTRQELRQAVLERAQRFLRQPLPEHTRMMVISGRYEYHNKGFDVFLKSLARLHARIQNQDHLPPVVAWCLVATENHGMDESLRRLMMQELGNGSSNAPGTTTHLLHDEPNDPIVRSCRQLNLNNRSNDKVKVIFVPAYLDGQDGFFDLPYLDVLSACDAGIFPSYYEPWGYTPLESMAMGVPAVTTDLAGFGRWIQDLTLEDKPGVWIVRRARRDEDSVVLDLASILEYLVAMEKQEKSLLPESARRVAERAEWSRFYRGYIQACDDAFTKAYLRVHSLDTSSFSDRLFSGYVRPESSSPNYRFFTVVNTLPDPIRDLRKLAYNLWWSWHPRAQELFAEIDPDAWEEINHNPVRLLNAVSREVLEDKADDKSFLTRYEQVLDKFSDYMNDGECQVPCPGELSSDHPIAYFSMEFCLHECLPIYSGGLGVLSGDHLKTASDLNLPLVGVGLLYREGYFRQQIDRDGKQLETYPFLDWSQKPITTVLDEHEMEMRVELNLPGRKVFARVWQIEVGRVKLYLLDTDVDENDSQDRKITWRLYSGNRRTRIEQEIVLGIGGVSLLEDKLGIRPAVYHLNEGHSAFLLLERIRRLSGQGLSFQEAREATKATSVFTTHTPVPAGNEEFDLQLMEGYFENYLQELGISFDQFVELGSSRTGEGQEPFSMTVLALKCSSAANAVSRLHQKVCREMWHDVWKRVTTEEVPIMAITNGIHLSSWLGTNMRRLYEQYLDIRLDENHDDPDSWERIADIPDDMLWGQHMAQKKRLMEKVRHKLSDDYVKRGEDPKLISETIKWLDSRALTIGFARRFASYKRAHLLFNNKEALEELVNHPDMPVQFIFAGKAHPNDEAGKEIIKKVVDATHDKAFRGRIVYLENYNMAIGRWLTQGVDVWLNNPARYQEASGTSGMKVLSNGGLNCSILDGWWDEAYQPGLGWAIEGGIRYNNPEHQDEVDATTLLKLLRHDIVPLYYDKNQEGIPGGWVKMMKQVLMSLCCRFTTARMVKEYHEKMYSNTVRRGATLCENDFAGIRELTAWKRKINARFSSVHIDRVSARGLKGDILPSGAPLEIEMVVHPGTLSADELRAELLLGLVNKQREVEAQIIVSFGFAQERDDSGRLHYRLSHLADESGNYRYTVRVVPTHHLLNKLQETGLACWA